MTKSKTPEESKVQMTEYVLPQHANVRGSVFGGQLVSWIDIAAAIAATRHAERVCVTASIDELHFLKPVSVGQVVHLNAVVTAVHKTSCEIRVECVGENPLNQEKFLVAQAYLTFVSLDDAGKPISMPKLKTVTAQEKRLEKEARLRKAHRLEFKEKIQKAEDLF